MVVYKIFCKVTGKSYIGATRRRVEQRMNAHRYRSNAGDSMKCMYPLSIAIREHGWENFEVSVLAHARTFGELQEMEKAAITLHRTMQPYGYNQIPGGGSSLALPTNTGKPAWNRGVPHTEKAKQKMSDARIGAKNYRARQIEYRGVVYSCLVDCRKAHQLSANQLYGLIRRGEATYRTPGVPGNYGAPHYKHTPETRQRMSETRRAHSPRRRAILLDGQTYVSIVAAVGVSGYTRDQIKKKLKRGTATYLDTPQPS